MKRPHAVRLSLLALTLSLSCSGSGGYSGGYGPPPTGIGLTVSKAVQSGSIEVAGQTLPAQKGSRYWSVAISLTNNTNDPAPLLIVLFSLETKSGLEFLGAPETAQASGGCPQNAAVSMGQTTQCTLVFSLPSDAIASGLHYEIPKGATADATLMPQLCTPCGNDCIDVSSDPNNCGACGVVAGALGHCMNGKVACSAGATKCGSTCVDLETDPNNCGACGVRVPPGTTCGGGNPSCADPSKISCNGQCVAMLDASHCGSCARDCEAIGSGSCEGGPNGSHDPSTFHCLANSKTPRSCADLCGNLTCDPDPIGAGPRYQCPDGSLIGFGSVPCAMVPPQSTADPGSGMICTFQENDCYCQ